jgi:putative SbcD/Mre11-related phosphoesterase
MQMRLIKNERAMVVGDFLVVGDLHIGYEKQLEERGYSVPSQVVYFIKKIIELKKETGASRLLLLGDIKYNIPRIAYEEKYDVPNLFRALSTEFEEIIVTKGNHDGNIERMIHENNVRIVNEFSFEGFGFTHGHRLPSEELLKCETVIIGHIHPTLKFRDELGVRHNYPCWMFAKFKKTKKFKDAKIKRVIVVPCFNPLFIGYSKFVGPFSKAIKIEEIYLLDLTKVK